MMENVKTITVFASMFSDNKVVKMKKSTVFVIYVTREALSDFESDEDILVVVDISGSIYCQLTLSLASVVRSMGL